MVGVFPSSWSCYVEKLYEVPSGGSAEYWLIWERTDIHMRFCKNQTKDSEGCLALTKISKPHCDYHLANIFIEYSIVSKMIGSCLLESLVRMFVILWMIYLILKKITGVISNLNSDNMFYLYQIVMWIQLWQLWKIWHSLVAQLIKN